MRQEFVTFFSPGTFVSESTTTPIASRDPVLAAKMASDIRARYDAKPFAFRFETRLVHDPVPDGDGGTLRVESKTVDTSALYFLGGELLFAHEVQESESILRSNMRCNRWPICIVNKNSYRVTQPFNPEDCIVNGDGVVVRRGTDADLMAYRRAKLAEWDAA